MAQFIEFFGEKNPPLQSSCIVPNLLYTRNSYTLKKALFNLFLRKVMVSQKYFVDKL